MKRAQKKSASSYRYRKKLMHNRRISHPDY